MSFTIFIPTNAPTIIRGSINKLNLKVSQVIVFQIVMWKGTLKTLTRKKNQADVPMKLFFGRPILKK